VWNQSGRSVSGYFALLIGIDNYKEHQKLNGMVADVADVADYLKEKFGD
jgi:hypothetical protein